MNATEMLNWLIAHRDYPRLLTPMYARGEAREIIDMMYKVLAGLENYTPPINPGPEMMLVVEEYRMQQKELRHILDTDLTCMWRKSRARQFREWETPEDEVQRILGVYTCIHQPPCKW